MDYTTFIAIGSPAQPADANLLIVNDDLFRIFDLCNEAIS